SDADVNALHVRLAGWARNIGPAPAAESYLDQDKLIAVARETGCDAVHPGYGFLAESVEFSARVVAAGLTWIGPPPEAMRLMGLKTAARKTARDAGVATIPGFDKQGATDSELAKAAGGIGYPVMVKADAGGGGKGMRIVDGPGKLASAIAAARREAGAAFGDDSVYLEKLIERPRHIEIQVLADGMGNIVHLGERECSIQRRHQKLIEETPSTVVDAAMREAMGGRAVNVARKAGYVGAGTVEFMVDGEGNFYFLEMNARLQVEHPVTELAYGVDLVHWQLRIASGEPLTLKQGEIAPRGHSIECRIYAEDAATGFLPAVGRVDVLHEPSGPGVRVDSMLYPGWEVGPHYDPLLAKLIVWGEDRGAAIARMARALEDYRVLGVTTNLPFLHDVITHPAFAAGETSTGFIAVNFPDWSQPVPSLPHKLAAALALATQGHARALPGMGEAGPPTPWQSLGGWSNA
ncbi:ATP-grasp domain-containing protein, partial [bacterium]|nr:ATP-grasp domain-containing protein [bacterium]